MASSAQVFHSRCYRVALVRGLRGGRDFLGSRYSASTPEPPVENLDSRLSNNHHHPRETEVRSEKKSITYAILTRILDAIVFVKHRERRDLKGVASAPITRSLSDEVRTYTLQATCAGRLRGGLKGQSSIERWLPLPRPTDSSVRWALRRGGGRVPRGGEAS